MCVRACTFVHVWVHACVLVGWHRCISSKTSQGHIIKERPSFAGGGGGVLLCLNNWLLSVFECALSSALS